MTASRSALRVFTRLAAEPRTSERLFACLSDISLLIIVMYLYLNCQLTSQRLSTEANLVVMAKQNQMAREVTCRRTVLGETRPPHVVAVAKQNLDIAEET